MMLKSIQNIFRRKIIAFFSFKYILNIFLWWTFRNCNSLNRVTVMIFLNVNTIHELPRALTILINIRKKCEKLNLTFTYNGIIH